MPLHQRSPGVAAALVALLALAAPAMALTFEDAQGSAGIAWVHASSDNPKTYPETNGSGTCWGDVDGDGIEDLVLVNGLHSNATNQALYDPRSALYLNDGDGTFTDASRAWGADVSAWGQGCSLADPDADGDLDLLIVGYDTILLLRNDGERFTDITAAANLSLEGKCGEAMACFAESGSWADYDMDGDLDLYIANMVDYDIVEDRNAPVTPTLYNGQPNILFRNRGNGTFEDVTAQANAGDDPGPDHSKSFQSLWADYDRDGDPDLYIASDTTPNTLFRNDGGVFTDVAFALGVDDPRSSMGLVFQDIDGDACPDLYMTHYQGENNGFYTQGCGDAFRDRSGEGELNNDWLDVGWGTGFHDFDHDGDLDIYAANGHTSSLLADFKQKPRLWLQLPNGTFDDVSAQSGPSFNTTCVCRGSAAADFDLDGDLDLAFIGNHNESARLLRHNGASGNWLQVELREPSGANRFALGAEVTITPEGGAPVMRILQAGSSFLSQDSLVVHAGLGSATRADVHVRWPGGANQTWLGIEEGQRVRLTKGSAAVARDTLSPLTTPVVVEGVGQNGWFRGPITYRVDAVDRALHLASGVDTTEVRQAGSWQPYAGPFTITSDGIHAIAVRSTDLAGNREPPRAFEARIDATPPATAVTVEGSSQDGWYRRAAFVNFVSSDALSGPFRVWSRVDDGPWEAGPGRVLTEAGTHLVEFYGEDLAGNLEAPQSAIVRVDEDVPAVALRPWPLALGFGTVRLEADATDAGSGVRSVAFWVQGEARPRHVDLDGSDGWTWDAPGLLVGHARAVATDGVGFEGQDEALLVALSALPFALPLALPLVLPFALLAARRR